MPFELCLAGGSIAPAFYVYRTGQISSFLAFKITIIFLSVSLCICVVCAKRHANSTILMKTHNVCTLSLCRVELEERSYVHRYCFDNSYYIFLSYELGIFPNKFEQNLLIKSMM